MTTDPESGDDRSALILYATETGTAQDIASSLRPLLAQQKFATVEVIPCDDLPSPSYLHHYTICILVVATAGQGDIPNNAREFWRKLLRKRLVAGAELSGVRFACVGLGDRAYLKFNWAARKVRKRLIQLGAEEVVEACEADESGEEGVEGGVNEWLVGFETWLKEEWLLLNDGEQDRTKLKESPRWLLEPADKHVHHPYTNGAANGSHLNGSTVSHAPSRPQLEDEFAAILTQNQRLTPPDHWQDVRVFRFHTPLDLDYLPGDALALLPENDPEDVSTLLDLMGWTSVANVPIVLKPAPSSISNGAATTNRTFPCLERPPLPHLTMPNSSTSSHGPSSEPTTTLRDLLTTTLDISAIPRRSFFRTLARYCTNDTFQRERLLEFTDPQFLDEYFDYATRPRRSILEILQEFQAGVRVPWQEALEILPVLRPRLFSIASAKGMPSTGGEGGTTFELLIAIVKYRTVIRRIRRGVCTRWLEGLPAGTKINVTLRTEGRFIKNRGALLQPGGTKHVLVGAGTGLAPLRSLVWEKELTGLHDKRSGSNGTNGSLPFRPSPVGETFLIFGARNSQQDFFFKDEWQSLQHGSVQTSNSFKLMTAFSRDQSEKIYVQDRIREHRTEVARLVLDDMATFVVCGSSGNMPKAVRQALIDVLAEYLMGAKGAENYVEQMQKEGRYLQETW
jgi:sulfite reductase alpha subunit-like flavoprotein